MTSQLDRRAGAAAAAVRAAVADLAPRTEAAPAPRRPRWPALVAAVVLVVAAIGGVVVLQRDDGESVVAGLPGVEGLRLIPDDVPAGLELHLATDLPGEGSQESTFKVYGRGPEDDPFRDGDLAIIVTQDGDVRIPPEGNVELRGVPGDLSADEGQGGTLSWGEPGLGSVMVVSRTVEGEQLVAFAEGLRREGHDLVGTPPAGLTLVADLDSQAPAGGGVPSDAGSSIFYQQPESGRTLGVTTVPDEPGMVEVFRWLSGGEARRTTVRGHAGWVAASFPDGGGTLSSGLVWHEGPGVLTAVSATGLDEEEVRRVAEGLRPATDDQWQALLDEAGEP
jgi:hypothetical protein